MLKVLFFLLNAAQQRLYGRYVLPCGHENHGDVYGLNDWVDTYASLVFLHLIFRHYNQNLKKMEEVRAKVFEDHQNNPKLSQC